MRIRTLALCALVATLPVLGGAGCSASDEVGASQEAQGTMALPLVTTGSSGTVYRLTNAAIQYSGPESGAIATTEHEDLTVVNRAVRAGEYVVTLAAGWSLERRLTDGTFEAVNAVLASPNPMTVSVTDQATTQVALRFRAGDDVLEFGDGRLAFTIVVEEVGIALCTPGEVRCSGDTVEECNTQGTGWVAGTVCSEGCDAARGGCIQPNACRLTLPGASGAEPGGLIPVCCSIASTDGAAATEFVTLLNAYRAANGRGTLAVHAPLAEAAQGHAMHMAAHPFFEHTAPESAVSSPWARANLCGTNAAGENLAMGTALTAPVVLQMWQDSALHNQNLLQPGFTRIGIGLFQGHWVALFGN